MLMPRRMLPRIPRGLLPLVPIRSPRLLVSPPMWSPAAKKRLADAQGALGGLHAAHMKEAGEAASAQAQAAAAEATCKLKEKNVANHQKAVNESAKKIGEQ